MTSDIVETAIEAGSFQTLVAAVIAAGLADTLKGKGPFTVFAPTDAAFAKLPAGTIQGLLADKAKLTSLLTYHVVPGRVMAAEVVKVRSAKSVQGGNLKVSAENGTVTIDAAKVIQADVLASNGVIHAIDAVLSPQ
ncbi:MAG: fasciclin domain-containing protein [Acidobacteriota bacterium]